MTDASSFVSTQDDIEIKTFTWPTAVEPVIGVVQIAHGLAEYGTRYARFAAHSTTPDFTSSRRIIVDTAAPSSISPATSDPQRSPVCGPTSSNSANHCSRRTRISRCSCSPIRWDRLLRSTF